jgi:hypothetical protein
MFKHLLPIKSPASSVSTMSDYRMDGQGSIPVEAKGFSCSLCVQTSSKAHPASYPMGTGGSFPRDTAWPGHKADHSHPSSAEVKNE